MMYHKPRKNKNMKLTVTYFVKEDDESCDDKEYTVSYGKELEDLDPEDLEVLDAMQNVSDEFEDRYATVDHGGDENTYELTLPDEFSSHSRAEKLASKLLDRAGKALEEIVVSRKTNK